MITTKDKPDGEMKTRRLTHGELLELRRGIRLRSTTAGSR